MLPSQRTALIQRGLDTLATFFPATLVFAGFDPIPAKRRAQQQAPVLGLGFNATAPTVFLVDKADIPGGLTITPQITTFTVDGVAFRIEQYQNEPADPHIRLGCDLSAR